MRKDATPGVARFQHVAFLKGPKSCHWTWFGRPIRSANAGIRTSKPQDINRVDLPGRRVFPNVLPVNAYKRRHTCEQQRGMQRPSNFRLVGMTHGRAPCVSPYQSLGLRDTRSTIRSLDIGLWIRLLVRRSPINIFAMLPPCSWFDRLQKMGKFTTIRA
jgi:hypothetical protein